MAAGLPVVGAPAERAGTWLDKVARSPGASNFSLTDVTVVIGALEAARIPFWLAGGWGVDALLGTQTRFHDDLDLVVDDLAACGPCLAKALARAGFSPAGARVPGVWWKPLGLDFTSRGRLRIEILEVNWDLLAAGRHLLAAGEASRDEVLDLRAQVLGRGELGNRPVPCISLAAQTLFHQGYAGSTNSAGDLARLRKMSAGSTTSVDGAHTSLVVPVFSLRSSLRRVWTAHNSSLKTPPPHVTVVHPFISPREVTEEAIAHLSDLFAEVEPFCFQLAHIDWFANRVAYLAPEPRDAFVALTAIVVRSFPSTRPYHGAFEEIVPHLTLAEDLPVRTLRQVARRAMRALPVHGQVREVWLVETQESAWHLLARFPLDKRSL